MLFQGILSGTGTSTRSLLGTRVVGCQQLSPGWTLDYYLARVDVHFLVYIWISMYYISTRSIKEQIIQEYWLLPIETAPGLLYNLPICVVSIHLSVAALNDKSNLIFLRSEERRVGKECRN